MKKITYLKGIFSLFLVTNVFAQTPAPTATPLACTKVQNCVDTKVAEALSSCSSAEPTCTLNSNTDRYGVSAGVLARRAIDIKDCKSKTKRGACKACYSIAKIPLLTRFNVKLFDGMLAHTVKLIEDEKKAVCTSLPVN